MRAGAVAMELPEPTWVGHQPPHTGESARQLASSCQLQALLRRYRVPAGGAQPFNSTSFTGGKFLLPEDPQVYLQVVELLACLRGTPWAVPLVERTLPDVGKFYLDLDWTLPGHACCPAEILALGDSSSEPARLASDCFVAVAHQAVVFLVADPALSEAVLLTSCGYCRVRKSYKASFRLVYPALYLPKDAAKALALLVAKLCHVHYGCDRVQGELMTKVVDQSVYDKNRLIRYPYADKGARLVCATCRELGAGGSKGLCLKGSCRTVLAGRPCVPVGRVGVHGELATRGLSWQDFLLDASVRQRAGALAPPPPSPALVRKLLDLARLARTATIVLEDEPPEWSAPSPAPPLPPATPEPTPLPPAPADAAAAVRAVAPRAERGGAPLYVPWERAVPGRLYCEPRGWAPAPGSACGFRELLERLVAPYLGAGGAASEPLLNWAQRASGSHGDRASGWLRVTAYSNLTAPTAAQAALCPFQSAVRGAAYRHQSNFVSAVVNQRNLFFVCHDDQCEPLRHLRIRLPAWALGRLGSATQP